MTLLFARVGVDARRSRISVDFQVYRCDTSSLGSDELTLASGLHKPILLVRCGAKLFPSHSMAA